MVNERGQRLFKNYRKRNYEYIVKFSSSKCTLLIPDIDLRAIPNGLYADWNTPTLDMRTYHDLVTKLIMQYSAEGELDEDRKKNALTKPPNWRH